MKNDYLEELENSRKEYEIKEKQLLNEQKSKEYELQKRKLEIERLQNLNKYKHDLEIKRLEAMKREKEQLHERDKIKVANNNKLRQKSENIKMNLQNDSSFNNNNRNNMFDMIYNEMIENSRKHQNDIDKLIEESRKNFNNDNLIQKYYEIIEKNNEEMKRERLIQEKKIMN